MPPAVLASEQEPTPTAERGTVTEGVAPEPSRRERRRLLARGLLRALASTVAVFGLYALVPLEGFTGLPVGVPLAGALAILFTVTGWQVSSITRATHPGLRAVESFAIVAPLFLLLFAASYVILAQDDPASFSQPTLSRTDALYFTVTTFATVGFGDIVPTTAVARRLVTGQMLLDLLVLGAGIKVFIGAVQRGRRARGSDAGSVR